MSYNGRDPSADGPNHCAPGGVPPRVLVVEEDERKRDRIAAEFSRHGYLVENARDSREALAKASRAPYDVALLSAQFVAHTAAVRERESLSTRLKALQPGMECLVLNRRAYQRATLPADEILSLTERVLRQRQAARRDRRLAQCLEETVLPQPCLSLPPFDIACIYQPVEIEDQVGGDFYDLFPLGDRRLGIFVGDVSGRGLLVASHAAMARYYARAYARQRDSPASVLAQLNRALEFDTPDETFVTLFFGVLDLDSRRLIWGSAGHEPALLLPTEAPRPISLLPTGMALGMLPEAEYGEAVCDLPTDALLLLYTDGLIDSWIREGDPVDESLAGLLLQVRGRPAAVVTSTIMSSIYPTDADRGDDVTLVALTSS